MVKVLVNLDNWQFPDSFGVPRQNQVILLHQPKRCLLFVLKVVVYGLFEAVSRNRVIYVGKVKDLFFLQGCCQLDQILSLLSLVEDHIALHLEVALEARLADLGFVLLLEADLIALGIQINLKGHLTGSS